MSICHQKHGGQEAEQVKDREGDGENNKHSRFYYVWQLNCSLSLSLSGSRAWCTNFNQAPTASLLTWRSHFWTSLEIYKRSKTYSLVWYLDASRCRAPSHVLFRNHTHRCSTKSKPEYCEGHVWFTSFSHLENHLFHIHLQYRVLCGNIHNGCFSSRLFRSVFRDATKGICEYSNKDLHDGTRQLGGQHQKRRERTAKYSAAIYINTSEAKWESKCRTQVPQSLK